MLVTFGYGLKCLEFLCPVQSLEAISNPVDHNIILSQKVNKAYFVVFRGFSS